MCGADESVDLASGSWIRARVRHQCCACREYVRPGDLYHREATKYEGYFDVYVHCARCWQMFRHLQDLSDNPVLYTLDCGEHYEAPDDDEGHKLAFMTPDEAQLWAVSIKGEVR